MTKAGPLYTFPQAAKLKKSADFLRVLKARGEKVIRLSGHWIEVKAILDSGAPGTRIGLTVGKTNARRAVDRNLVKRIFRESARHCFFQNITSENSSKPDIKIVLRLRNSLNLLNAIERDRLIRGELQKETEKLLELMKQKLQHLTTSNIHV